MDLGFFLTAAMLALPFRRWFVNYLWQVFTPQTCLPLF
jgi:hypothetical protein